MRAARRALSDQELRSAAIWRHVESLDALRSSNIVMAFDSIRGEPVTEGFVARRRAAGQLVVIPEDEPPPDAAQVDVVLVPGIAFTLDGDRLGQGGGWYDRFLAGVRSTCTTIGVGFEIQIVDAVPIETHDIALDAIVTERRVHWVARKDAG
jgi:5-formyltetrahydrofolate cyclo-ligase